MKQFILISLICASTFISKAQPALGGCNIKYEYDACGNRIKRSKICYGPPIIPSREAKPTSNSTLEMKVYPNPANQVFTVELNQKLANAKLDLIDMCGRTVLSKKVHNQSINFDISSFSKGTYLLILKQAELNDFLSQKVIKH